MLVKLDGYKHKNPNRSILNTLHKTQLQIDKKNLTIKPDMLNQIEEKMGDSLEDFLNRTLLAWALKSSADKWNLMKLRNFCM